MTEAVAVVPALSREDLMKMSFALDDLTANWTDDQKVEVISLWGKLPNQKHYADAQSKAAQEIKARLGAFGK